MNDEMSFTLICVLSAVE